MAEEFGIKRPAHTAAGSIDSLAEILHVGYEHLPKRELRRYDRMYVAENKPEAPTRQQPSYDNRVVPYRR